MPQVLNARRWATAILLSVLLVLPIIPTAPPAEATSCVAIALKPILIPDGTRVRFRGAGSCFGNVKGIKVHIAGIVEGEGPVVDNDAYIGQNTCGGPNHAANITRCPSSGYYAISTPRRSGYVGYTTEVIIDVYYQGGSRWVEGVDIEQNSDVLP